MKAMGMTSEQIMKVTGLSLAEIESLLQEGIHKEYIFTKEALHLRQPLFLSSPSPDPDTFRLGHRQILLRVLNVLPGGR